MKRYIKSSNDEYLDEFLEEFAYETCDLNEEFNEDEFAEFKAACKDNGFKVTKRDFQIYLDKVKDIRNDDQDEFDEIEYEEPKYSKEVLDRKNTAMDPSTPLELLKKLADDDAWVVRYAAYQELSRRGIK